MGSLSYFNLNDYVNQYNLNGFLETGLGHGHGIQYATTCNFEICYSIEISKEVIQRYHRMYGNNSKINIIQGTSKFGLQHVFEHDSNKQYLIFLDAHFPAADLGFAGFNDEKNDSLKYPLLDELKIIKSRADKGYKDVIIVDDLMFYSNEIFPDSHIKSYFKIEPPKDNNCLDKIMSYFDKTHKAELVKQFSGFGIFTPN